MPDESRDVLRNLGAVEEAEQRAFVRGQETTMVKSRLDEHDKRLMAINGSIERSAKAQGILAEEVHSLKNSFEKNIAIASARAQDAKEAAKEAAEAQVSTRTFVLGLIGAVTAIGSLLAATGHV